MAFIGKNKAVKQEKHPAVTISHHVGRMGLLFRHDTLNAGAKIDVLVGTDEDKGKILIKFDDNGKEITPIGKLGKTFSWSAIRDSAAKNLPELRRAERNIS